MLAQIGIFVEFERLRDVADREHNVLDRRAAAIEADTDVFANLFDLRLQIALAYNIAGLVERDLAPDDDQCLSAFKPGDGGFGWSPNS